MLDKIGAGYSRPYLNGLTSTCVCQCYSKQLTRKQNEKSNVAKHLVKSYSIVFTENGFSIALSRLRRYLWRCEKLFLGKVVQND